MNALGNAMATAGLVSLEATLLWNYIQVLSYMGFFRGKHYDLKETLYEIL